VIRSADASWGTGAASWIVEHAIIEGFDNLAAAVAGWRRVERL